MKLAAFILIFLTICTMLGIHLHFKNPPRKIPFYTVIIGVPIMLILWAIWGILWLIRHW